MKAQTYILVSVFVAIILATSCRKTDEYLKLEDEVNDDGYTTVPFSITVGISPMTDNIDGVELKTTFSDGDVIEISNPKILAEPAILTSNDCDGKSKATFSDTLKVRLDKTLTPGHSTLTAVLKNTDDASLYNNGRPFMSIKKLNDLPIDVNRSSYWACENFTYNSDATAIDLVQSTRFVKFDVPFSDVTFTMSQNNIYSYDIEVVNDTLYAAPYGMVLQSVFLNSEQALDEKEKYFYTIKSTPPDDCLPGAFSVADHEVVYFSKGNLQYHHFDEPNWRLASCQYDLPQSYDINGLHWWNGEWVNDGDYDENGFIDFNCVLGKEWSVLSFKEWNYLLCGRPNAATKYGVAYVAGLKGVILLPDNWQMTEGFKLLNDYSKDEWTQMEEAGAVFLPFEGDENPSFPYNFKYWTSSAIDYEKIAVKLESGNIILDERDNENCDGAVRLVQRRYLSSLQFDNPTTPIDDVDRCIEVEIHELEVQSFCIRTHGFFKGQRYELSMKVRADKSEYNSFIQPEITDEPNSDVARGWIMEEYYFPKIDRSSGYLYFTSEWTDFKLTGEFSSSGRTIRFVFYNNIANKYYFDDISLKIDGIEVVINGDCSTADSRSFATSYDTEPSNHNWVTEPITSFIDKNTLPVQPIIKQGTIVFKSDFTTLKEYPYDDYWGCNPSVDPENGLVCDSSAFAVAEHIPTQIGKHYSVTVEIKGKKAGSLEAHMLVDPNIFDYTIKNIEVSTKWETKTFTFDEPAWTDVCAFVFYINNSHQTIYIRNIKIIDQGY